MQIERFILEAKLLSQPFSTWKTIRVEHTTYAFNEKSRNPILRIGAQVDDTLRQHIITESGRFRDTVYFSILDSEWQNVKGNPEAK